MPRPTPWNAPAAWIATGFGLSANVPAGGTVGGVLGIPLWLAISQAPGFALQAAILGVLIGLGVPICTLGARQLAELHLAATPKDPGAVSYDEFTTVAMVYMFAPAASGWWLLAGFALHRLFDITKVWPCHRLEFLPEGWGIMADDIVAAVYAGTCYRLLWLWLGAA